MADTITFKAWFMLDEDGDIKMVDTALPPNDDEERFGPFTITIPIPGRIKMAVADRIKLIKGIVDND